MHSEDSRTQELTYGAMLIAVFGVILVLNRQTAGLFEELIFFILPIPMTIFTIRYGRKDSLFFHLFHSRVCIALLKALPPRWTFGLARNWSSGSRKKHADGADGFDINASGLPAFIDGIGRKRSAAGESPVDYYIFGHIHTPSRTAVPSGGELIILGDWSRGPAFFSL